MSELVNDGGIIAEGDRLLIVKLTPQVLDVIEAFRQVPPKDEEPKTD